MMENKKHFDIWHWLKSTGGKMTIVITLIVGLQFLIPAVKDAIIGDDITSKQEFKDSIRILRVDIFRLKEDYLEFRRLYMFDLAKGRETAQVGLRVDPTGNLWYQTSYRKRYRAYRSYEYSKYRYTDSTGTSHFTDFED